MADNPTEVTASQAVTGSTDWLQLRGIGLKEFAVQVKGASPVGTVALEIKRPSELAAACCVAESYTTFPLHRVGSVRGDWDVRLTFTRTSGTAELLLSVK
jgi:hypothetical protein